MRKLTLTSFLSLILLVLLALPTHLGAQGVTSSALGGRVTDASGNPVAGAAITAVDTSTGTRYTSVSRQNGQWDIPNVKTGGPFSITASANGQSKTRSGIFTTLSQTAEVNLQLGPAAAAAPATTTTTTTTTETGATTERVVVEG